MDDPFRTWLIRGEFVGMQQQHVPITFFSNSARATKSH